MTATTQESHGGPPRAEPSDHSLLRRLRYGSQDAATQLYLRYVHRLRAVARAKCSPDLARRVDIDDIIQSVFGSFFRGVSQGHYDVPAEEELWRLLHVITLNKVRAKGAFHRAAKRDVRLTAAGADLHRDAGLEISDDRAACEFLRLTVAEALAALPAPHRTVLELRIEGYEVAEIARKAGRSKRTVERLLLEARQALHGLLREEP